MFNFVFLFNTLLACNTLKEYIKVFLLNFNIIFIVGEVVYELIREVKTGTELNVLLVPNIEENGQLLYYKNLLNQHLQLLFNGKLLHIQVL